MREKVRWNWFVVVPYLETDVGEQVELGGVDIYV